jgi:hypothetical protein
MDFIATAKPLWWVLHSTARVFTSAMLMSDFLASFWHISEVDDQNRQMVSRSDRTLAKACAVSARYLELSGLATATAGLVKPEAGVADAVSWFMQASCKLSRKSSYNDSEVLPCDFQMPSKSVIHFSERTSIPELLRSDASLHCCC